MEDQQIRESSIRTRPSSWRVAVDREATLGSSKHRPRRLLSKGVRIYNHYEDGAVLKQSFNVAVGLRIIQHRKLLYAVRAVGSEEGAVAIHYVLPYPSWIAYAVPA